MTVKIFKDKDQISQYFADMLIDSIRKIPDEEYYSIALSGGSTPKAIFEYLASNYKETIDWNKLIVFWGDERCVPPDSSESNFRMASESLLDHVPIPKENIFRIKGENNPEYEAERYADILCTQLRSYEGCPQFDLNLLGLGTDGHTASIFPDSLYLFDSEKLCEVAVHPETGQSRITITGKVINNAKIVVFLVTGDGKAEKVAAIIEQQDGCENLPASLVRPQQGELIWLLDDQAALHLKTKV